ncbi:MAG: glutamate--tRNA ligase [Parcubacteria group bacterium]|jgi:glutamyl-tRNA synthetase
MENLRVRIAPSPTGFVHIGNFRTILYNFLFAKKNGADFVLRIEDTDQKRFVEGALENLLATLEWAGITWDEGPIKQSGRLEIYKKYAEQLVKDGHAYYCFCEPKRLEEMRKEQQAQKLPPIYDQYCLRNITPEEVNKKLKENCPYTIRLKMPKDETIEFEDIIRGKIKFETNLVDDQVLLKSDGFPTYHLAVVVDDHEMNITHVIRGEEWLSSVPKHLLLYRYLGWEPPQFAHVPLLLNSDRSKLSKRQGDVAVEDYIKKGYLKEAIINFVAFLGWNPGEGSTKEIFSLEELIKEFKLERVHKGGAVFDIKKLDWLNSEWIKKISPDNFRERALPFIKEKEFYKNLPDNQETAIFINKLLGLEQQRIYKLSEIGDGVNFFFHDIEYDKELLRWKGMTDEEIKKSLEKSQELLSDIKPQNWSLPNLGHILMEAAGDKRGELLWPLRVALTGEQKSPSPFEVAWVLGKDKTIALINKAINLV